ncbi:TolC family protein [Dyella sp.]|uniref:TolC family protein n=1 Tax=Dyella sp. TaxID=1869338 RepID=UPI002ED4743C
MLFLRAALFGAALCCRALPAFAQAPAASPALRESIRHLWENSPEVQAARASMDAARAGSRAAAQPFYNPSLSIDAENADVNRRTVGVSLPLDVSGKRRTRAAEGEAALQVEDARYELARRDVAARWLKARSAATLAAQQRFWGERRVLLMKRFDELAGERLAAGDISSSERDLAGLALGEAQLQQASLIADEAAAQAQMMALTGQEQMPTLSLPQTLSAPESIRPLAAEALPESRMATAQQALADASVAVAQSMRRSDPTLSLTTGQVRAGRQSDPVIGLSLSIPLPVLNTGRADVEAARARANAVAVQRQAQLWNLRARLREAQARYRALYVAHEAFIRGRAGAFDERAALLEKLWRAGEIGTSEYLLQLRQSLDTVLSGVDLKSRAWQSWFDYLQAAGQLTAWIDGDDKELQR